MTIEITIPTPNETSTKAMDDLAEFLTKSRDLTMSQVIRYDGLIAAAKAHDWKAFKERNHEANKIAGHCHRVAEQIGNQIGIVEATDEKMNQAVIDAIQYEKFREWTSGKTREDIEAAIATHDRTCGDPLCRDVPWFRDALSDVEAATPH